MYMLPFVSLCDKHLYKPIKLDRRTDLFHTNTMLMSEAVRQELPLAEHP